MIHPNRSDPRSPLEGWLLPWEGVGEEGPVPGSLCSSSAGVGKANPGHPLALWSFCVSPGRDDVGLCLGAQLWFCWGGGRARAALPAPILPEDFFRGGDLPPKGLSLA